LNDDKANESNKQEHPQSLNQETYKNIKAENYSNNGHAVEAGVAVMEFTDNHQQCKEEKDDEKQEEKEEGTSYK
jgi:hypothetical protein